MGTAKVILCTSRRVVIFAFVNVFLLLLAASRPPIAHAATITVTNTNDSGAGSLRQAIADAASGDTINFGLSGCPCTIMLTTTTLTINKNLTITGPGADQLTISGFTASIQVLHINTGLTVSLSGLTIANGFTTLAGGGLYIAGASTVTLNSVNVVGNTSSANNGGGISVDIGGVLTMTNGRILNNSAANGGGIFNRGTLTLNNVVSSGNHAEGFGYSTGGGIFNSYHMTLVNVAILGNSSAASGGGIENSAGDSTITNSVIDGNTAMNGYGGGLYNDFSATVTLTNVTLSNNAAQVAGGGAYNDGTLDLINSTVAFNRLSPTVGISGLGNSLMLTLKNTIVANNDGGNCSDIVTSQGNNLDSGHTCGFTASGDLHDKDPLFNSMINGGTPSQSLPLLRGSPAIDAGNNSGCPTTDQRGFVRPFDGDGNGSIICDIGAYEFGFPLFLPLTVR